MRIPYSSKLAAKFENKRLTQLERDDKARSGDLHPSEGDEHIFRSGPSERAPSSSTTATLPVTIGSSDSDRTGSANSWTTDTEAQPQGSIVHTPRSSIPRSLSATLENQVQAVSLRKDSVTGVLT